MQVSNGSTFEAVSGGIELPYKLANIHSHSAAMSEIYELAEEGLIGAESHSLGFISRDESLLEVPFVQWSEKANSQWWALNNEGPAGQEAAGLLQQMVDERRQLARDYMDGFFSLSKDLSNRLEDDGEPTADLDQLLDNVQAGRSHRQNEDGSWIGKGEVVDEFWQQNQAQIEALQQHYDELKNYPKHLSEWVERNGVETSSEVDRVIEKHRYSGLGDKRPDAEALIQNSTSTIHQQGDQPLMAHEDVRLTFIRFDDPFPAQEIDQEWRRSMETRNIEMALMMGDASRLQFPVASMLMNNERKELLTEYQQSFQPAYDAFYSQFPDGLEPEFSFQDLIDNVAAGREPAELDDGTLHPAADQITTFMEQQQSRIDIIVDVQEALDDFPISTQQWIDENQAELNEVIYQQFGLEPWETGDYARSLRPDILSYIETGENPQPQDINEYREQLKADLESRKAELNQSLRQLQGYSLYADNLSLEQVIENFRQGQPLGLREDGTIDPLTTKLEQWLDANIDDLVAVIDLSAFVHHGDYYTLDNFSADKQAEYADMADDLIKMIELSRGQLIDD